MLQPVIIKSNKYGINLILNSEISFEELLRSIAEKFSESEKFFKNARMAISFEGRGLTSEEEIQIIDTISNLTNIEIICIMENDIVREKYTKRQIDQFFLEESISTGKFHKGTLRSGQSLEVDSSIIILGDVNPGAKITATGNIVVLGSLKGTAYAGNPSNEECFVAALDMHPVQIKIGNIIGRSEDKGFLASLRERRKQASEPQMATVSEGQILIQSITKK